MPQWLGPNADLTGPIPTETSACTIGILFTYDATHLLLHICLKQSKDQVHCGLVYNYSEQPGRHGECTHMSCERLYYKHAVELSGGNAMYVHAREWCRHK